LPRRTRLVISSKAGQLFNNVAYAGLSSPVYGTLTYGRQSALSSDLIVSYDPISGLNAFSVLTFQGANGGGGDTEDRIFDNSFEYRVVGPVRFAVETQLRNGGNSGTGNAIQGDVGFDYMGLSMDFVGGKTYDAVSASPSVLRKSSRLPPRPCRQDGGLWLRRSPTTPCSRLLPNTTSGRSSCLPATSVSTSPTRITR
jgi:hypothetical protein